MNKFEEDISNIKWDFKDSKDKKKCVWWNPKDWKLKYYHLSGKETKMNKFEEDIERGYEHDFEEDVRANKYSEYLTKMKDLDPLYLARSIAFLSYSQPDVLRDCLSEYDLDMMEALLKTVDITGSFDPEFRSTLL